MRNKTMKAAAVRLVRRAVISTTVTMCTVALSGHKVKGEKSEAPRTDATYEIEHPQTRAPLRFEKNLGQADDNVEFLLRTKGMNLLLTATEAIFQLTRMSPKDRDGKNTAMTSWLLRLAFGGDGRPRGEESLPSRTNYFRGNNPSKWLTDIPHFARVHYDAVYQGIDLVFYGNAAAELEFDFVVAPGADYRQIQLEYDGAATASTDEAGNLLITRDDVTLMQRKPLAYQVIAGERRLVAANYIVESEHVISFRIGSYNPSYPLIIDPILVYSTYLGGASLDVANSLAVDADGFAYVSGKTWSTTFPVRGVTGAMLSGRSDVFVSKFTPSGSNLVYSTFLGGSDEDEAGGLTVDSLGSVYITGGTRSPDFPTVAPFQATFGGDRDVFVTKLAPSGNSLQYSTFIGKMGEEAGSAIAVDGSGNAYVTGSTETSNNPAANHSFPTVNAAQPNGVPNWFADSFALKLSANGNTLLYSTYLAGTFSDIALDLAIDGSGQAYIAGVTDSGDYPVANAYKSTRAGFPSSGFVTKLNAAGDQFLYSTFLGGNGTGTDSTWAFGIAVDDTGSAYVTGFTVTYSAVYQDPSVCANTFTLVNAFQTSCTGLTEAFVSKLSASGDDLVYSTFLGGAGEDVGVAIAVDADRNAYVVGMTDSPNFPTRNPFQGSIGGGDDAFITKLAPSGAAVIYSSYLGGSHEDGAYAVAVDVNGDAYLAGGTQSADFPVKRPFQSSYAYWKDAFVAKVGGASVFLR